MKKILFITAICAVISTASYSQAKFGVQVGGNLGFMQTETGNDDDFSNKPRVGILAGFLADVPLGPVSFRPEVNFIQKGSKNLTTITSIATTREDKLRLNYVEMPLNFVYNLQVGTGKVFFGLGPNFALGLSGKNEVTITSPLGTARPKNDVKFSGDNNSDPNTAYFKRFDFGGNILAGFQAGMGLTFNLGYTLGLSDISRNLPGDDDLSQKNHGITFKVGYLFGCSTDKAKTTTSGTTGSGTF